MCSRQRLPHAPSPFSDPTIPIACGKVRLGGAMVYGGRMSCRLRAPRLPWCHPPGSTPLQLRAAITARVLLPVSVLLPTFLEHGRTDYYQHVSPFARMAPPRFSAFGTQFPHRGNGGSYLNGPGFIAISRTSSSTGQHIQPAERLPRADIATGVGHPPGSTPSQPAPSASRTMASTSTPRGFRP